MVNRANKLGSFEEAKSAKRGLKVVTPQQGSAGEYMGRLVLNAYGMGYEVLKSWGGKASHTSVDKPRGGYLSVPPSPQGPASARSMVPDGVR